MDNLCLGTVQFGLKYGINNRTGQPSEEEVYEILDYAIENGISCFDTAVAYGNAEQIIGRYFFKNNLHKKIKLITKIHCDNSNEKLIESMETSLIKSLENLKTDFVDGCLLHNPNDFYNPLAIEGLIKLKKKNLVNKIGVSIYEPKEALDAVLSGAIDYIQIPFNVFDQRLIKTDFFDLAKKNKVTIFARSPLLQGLLMMNSSDVPKNLAKAVKYLDSLEEISERYNISKFDLALNFSRSNIGKTGYTVFGVDNLKQLKEYVNSKQIPFSDKLNQEILDNFNEIERNIIIPSLWSK